MARSARAEEVVVAARRLLEEEGAGALTMRRLAEQLGIKAPSLYKHLPDKAALEAAIIATGLEEAADRFEQAVGSATIGGAANGDAAGGGAAAISAVAAAYRELALAHPHLHRLMHNGPLPRRHLPAGSRNGPRRRCCGVPGVGRGLERCGRSPMAWSCSNSTNGSHPTPTSTRPGRLASRRSRRADLSLVWSPLLRGSGDRMEVWR